MAKEISGRGRRRSGDEKGNQGVGDFRFTNILQFFFYLLSFLLFYHFFSTLFLPTTFTHTHTHDPHPRPTPTPGTHDLYPLPTTHDIQLHSKSTQCSVLNSCKQTLFYFSYRSFQKHRRALENERGARGRKIKNVYRHLWGKRGVLSPSPMLTPHRYHLRVRSADYYLKYFTMKQQ